MIFVVCFIIVMIAKLLPSLVLHNMVSTISQHKPTLQGLVNYCCTHVPFYQRYSNHVPIITKHDIMQNYKDFFTQGKYGQRIQWTMDTSANSWTQTSNGVSKTSNQASLSFLQSLYLAYQLCLGRSIAQVTGGSSGNYFYQWYGINDLWWGAYSFIRGWVNMGWYPGDSTLVYYFHGANSIKLLKHVHGITVLVPKFTSAYDIDVASAQQFIDIINNKKIELVVSFPSVIFRVCQLMYRHGIRLTHVPRCMDLSADFLFTCQYQFIQQMFPSTDIRMSYGTIEFGQIAQQVPNHMFLYEVYDDVAYVENDKDGNLVVSAFNYKTLPLLRYRTDDKGKVVHVQGKQYIENLVGKQNSYIDYIDVDRSINDINIDGLLVINARFHIQHKTVILSVIDTYHAYLPRIFQGFDVVIEVCSHDQCNTVDTYNRKNTPILKEYDYTQAS